MLAFIKWPSISPYRGAISHYRLLSVSHIALSYRDLARSYCTKAFCGDTVWISQPPCITHALFLTLPIRLGNYPKGWARLHTTIYIQWEFAIIKLSSVSELSSNVKCIQFHHYALKCQNLFSVWSSKWLVFYHYCIKNCTIKPNHSKQGIIWLDSKYIRLGT